MLLAIDVGNTNIFLGIYAGEDLIRTFRLNTKAERSADEFGLLFLQMLNILKIAPESITGIILSSVVPNITDILERSFEKYFQIEAVVIGPGVKTGISIHTDNPKEVGADRITNVAAAYHKYNRSCIVIDFGTATTFDYVDNQGIFKHTIIMPGLKLSAKALFRGTAKLPDVELKMPDSILASNTVSGMQAGIMYGYIGAVKYTLAEQKQALADQPLVIATGGIAEDFVEQVAEIDIYEPNLALEGMKFIYKKNKGIKGDLK